jgi:hypothetical protein
VRDVGVTILQRVRVAIVELTVPLYRPTAYAPKVDGMRGRRLAAAGVVVAVVAAACEPAVQDEPTAAPEDEVNDQEATADEPPHPGPVAPEEGPWDPEAELRPDLMEIHPDETSPGEFVELHYPQETIRGVGFALEKRVDDGWEVRYFLNGSEGREPSDAPEVPEGWWMPPDNPDRLEWPSIGVVGPVDFALVPGPALPGDYRICTANTDPNFCAELTITR